MSGTNGNGNGSTAIAPSQVTSTAPIILHDTMDAFVRAITQEFTISSGIAPALFEAAVDIVCDSSIGVGGEVESDPVADFLNWEPKTTQNGFSMKRTIFAALLRNEDGSSWQAKVNFQPWDGAKQRHGKPYLAPRKNGSDDPRAYTPPVPVEIRQKISNRYGMDVPMTGSFWDWVKDSGVKILLTEGGKKTLATLSQGIIAVGFYGVNAGYRLDGDGGYRLIEDLESFDLGDREVLLAFDKDESKETQSKVSSATKKTAALLQAEGAIAKVVNWKAADGKGIDDVIVNKGAKFMQRAIDRAKVLPPLPIPEAKTYEEKPKGDAGAMIQWTPGMYLLSNIESILGQSLDSFITVLGAVHEWTGRYYKRREDGDLLKKIQKAFALYSYEAKGVTTFPFAKTSQSQESLSYLKIDTFLHPDKLTQSGTCLKNGILRINWRDLGNDNHEYLGFELVPHSKEYYFLSCSEVEYNPSADPSDVDRLLKAVPDDQRQTWLEHQALSFDFRKTAARFGRPRAGLHEGTGSNGKDACRQTIADIFPGMGAFTFEDFQQCQDGRPFAIASLPKYSLSWSSENSGNLKLEKLKALQNAISANGIMKSEFKNKDVVDYIPYCLFHFNVNKAPITEGKDFVKTRFVIYTYPYTYSSSGEPGTLEADERFAYDNAWRIKNVSSALLNRLIEAFEVAWNRGGVDYSPCEARLKEWAADRNHVLQFCNVVGLKEGGATESIEVSELWHLLENWYIEQDLLAITNSDRDWASDPSQFDPLVRKAADIFKRLQEIFPKIKRRRDTQTRRSVICGLKFVRDDEATIAPQPEATTAAPQVEAQQALAIVEPAKTETEPSVETAAEPIEAPAKEPVKATTRKSATQTAKKAEVIPVVPTQPDRVRCVTDFIPAPKTAAIIDEGEHPGFPLRSIVRYDNKFWRVTGFSGGRLGLQHTTLPVNRASALPTEVTIVPQVSGGKG